MKNSKPDFGKIGEDIACKFLSDKGFKIIQRNYRFERGEIDIIAEDGDVLVFVEVKTRTNLEYGPPEYAITKSKQKQIKKIAEAYLWEKEIKDRDCRIDVVAIILRKNNKHNINHIPNAF
ncbi:MAG: YraN family protein [bacterium]